jgi:hypothetical protein
MGKSASIGCSRPRLNLGESLWRTDAGQVSYEQQTWERLIGYLAELGGAREVGSGRIEVSLATATGARTVQIVMGQNDFSTWVSTINGSFWLTANDVRAHILDLPDDVPFLVFDAYELVPSQTETLPAEPDEEN